MRRPTHALALLAILAAGAGVLAVRDSAAQTPPSFTETFDGSPLSPAPFAPSDWWVQYHHRSPGAWAAPEMMEAQHDSTCAAPPATHHVMAWPDSVFHCRDHIMTAISASSYGVLYLTPPAMVDFSQGEAVVRFDISTARLGPRDWWDVWVTPKADAMALPLETDWPDLQGVPKNAVTVRLNESQYRFNGLVSRNYAVAGLPTNTGLLYSNIFTPSATLRQTVELRISRTHIQFGMPYPVLDNGSIGPPRWWINATVADLGWDQGVIHLGHHSYSPLKACTTVSSLTPSGMPQAITRTTESHGPSLDMMNVDVGVVGAVLMPTWTVRDSGGPLLRESRLSSEDAPLAIDSMWNRVKMAGIHAASIATEVINVHADHGGLAIGENVGGAGGSGLLALHHEAAIPSRVEPSHPRPASVFTGASINLAPKVIRDVGDMNHLTAPPDDSIPQSNVANCGASTWHWDNLTISPALPLPLARFPDHLIQDEADRPLPATAGEVWFSAVTNAVMSCSFDGGFTWQGATLVRGSRQQTTYGPVEHASSWRCAIPPGATAVRFRGANVAGWSSWAVFDPAVMP